MRVRMGAPGLAVSPASMVFRSTMPATGAVSVISLSRLLASSTAERAWSTWARAAATCPRARGLGAPRRRPRLLDLLGAGAGHEVVELGLGAGHGGARLLDLLPARPGLEVAQRGLRRPEPRFLAPHLG